MLVGGVAALLISLIPAFAVTSAAFLFTASNRWVLDADWNVVNQISFEIWASSFLTPQTVGATTFRLTPLLLTALNLVALHLACKHSGAKNWLQAGAVALSFAVCSSLLAGFKVQHTHTLILIIGIWVSALLSWASTWRNWEERPQWWEKLEFAKLAPQQFTYWAGTLAVAALLGLVFANYRAWERVVGVHELLNASTADTLVIIGAQLLFLPNLLAAVSSWYSGAGVYIAEDALQTPQQVIVAPIPAIPEMAITPQTPVGMWVIVFPMLVGVVAGGLLAWKQAAHSLKTQALSAAVAAPAFYGLLTLTMYAASASYGNGRLSHVGPNWLLSGALLSLEILIPALIVQGLLHAETRSYLIGKIKPIKSDETKLINDVTESAEPVNEDTETNKATVEIAEENPTKTKNLEEPPEEKIDNSQDNTPTVALEIIENPHEKTSEES